jgi:hypothetical protein
MRCLNDLELLAPSDAETAFAERLALWIHFTDAIPLSAVHNGELPPCPSPSSATGTPAQALALAAEFNQAKAALVNGVIKAFAAPPGHVVGGLPVLPLTPPASAAAIWLPYRRFYEAQQRDLDTRIQPLRAKLRGILALASPRMNKLAELDAMFDKILRGREQELLARVPLLLKTRFEQVFKQHQDHVTSGAAPQACAAWMERDGWLARFCKDMQMLLLAEAELRLQPALGLLEAFKKENHNE